jgi:hypothetical protein
MNKCWSKGPVTQSTLPFGRYGKPDGQVGQILKPKLGKPTTTPRASRRLRRVG